MHPRLHPSRASLLFALACASTEPRQVGAKSASAPPPPPGSSPSAGPDPVPHGHRTTSARCRVSSGSERVFDGPCSFEPDGESGSFRMATVDGTLLAGANPVTVSVIGPGLADVRGLTEAGINSRWGTAQQSTEDPACWDGADFQLCVWTTGSSR